MPTPVQNTKAHQYVMFFEVRSYVLYGLKLSGTKIFVDFMVIEVSMKILSLKIRAIAMATYGMHMHSG